MHNENAREYGRKQHQVAHEHGGADVACHARGHIAVGVFVSLPAAGGAVPVKRIARFTGWGETLGETRRRPEIDPPMANETGVRYTGQNVEGVPA